MLILSTSKITIQRPGKVKVEGELAKYHVRITQFMTELRLARATIHYRFGRYMFSGKIDERTQQRIRNFLLNECPLKK